MAWSLPAAIVLWAVVGAALGGVAVVVALVLLARAQIALHGPMVLWHRQRRGLLALLDAALALKPLQHPRWQAEADALHGDVQRLRAALGLGWVEQVPAVADYANPLALYQYRRFGRELVQLRDERPSLQVEDSLRTATSLYMAELDRARALSRATQQATPVLVLIDEIFRGTNHLESVAATAALAHELAGRALLLLATHHVVLAPLLGEELQPLCVSHDAQGAQQLNPGVLEEPNGLAMLADYDFAPATQATAAQVLAWLQSYMAHPSQFLRLGEMPTAP